MRGYRNALVLLLLFVCCTGIALAQQPFTYQGMLKNSGVPATGNFDFQFSLWTALSGGSQIGSTLTKHSVNVQNGQFTTELDFRGVWDGQRPLGADSGAPIGKRLAYHPFSSREGEPCSLQPAGLLGVDGAVEWHCRRAQQFSARWTRRG